MRVIVARPGNRNILAEVVAGVATEVVDAAAVAVKAAALKAAWSGRAAELRWKLALGGMHGPG